MTALDEIKRTVDLRQYGRDRYGLNCDSNGKCSCPLHPPDKDASFSIFLGKDGIPRWHCHHENIGGSIVDLVARLDGISEKEAINKLLTEFRLAPGASPTGKIKIEALREHVYLDVNGRPVFKKIKYKPNTEKIIWGVFRYENGGWQPRKGDRVWIPYRLEKFKEHDQAIICEGEKDADTINGIGADYFATSAPSGCSAWPDEITPHFAGFKGVTFLYDVGNDEHVLKHAAKLHAAFPKLVIKIAKVPGTQREFDITDYLGDMEGRADAMFEILAKARLYPPVEVVPILTPIAAPADMTILEELNVDNVFLNDFVSSNAAVTDAPKIFLLFSGIALLSGIANKYYFFWPRRIHLNLYLLLLAPSTFCRKSTCTDIVSDYLRAVNPNLLLPESFTTEALFEILNATPRGLVIWRELIQVKEFMFGSEYNKGLPAFLTDAYDYKEEFKRRTKGEGEISVKDPIISILAAGIASWFVKNLNEVDFQGGIWTRFLIVPAPDQNHKYRLPERFSLDPSIRSRLINLDTHPEVELDVNGIRSLVAEWGARHLNQSLNLENTILQAIFLRLEVMLLKLAALFQLADDGSIVVGEAAFRDAERVIDYIKRRLPPFFKEEVQFTPFDQSRAKIEKYLKEKGPASKGAILRNNHIESRWATKILEQLIEEGRAKRVRIESDEKRGRRTELYQYVY